MLDLTEANVPRRPLLTMNAPAGTLVAAGYSAGGSDVRGVIQQKILEHARSMSFSYSSYLVQTPAEWVEGAMQQPHREVRCSNHLSCGGLPRLWSDIGCLHEIRHAYAVLSHPRADLPCAVG